MLSLNAVGSGQRAGFIWEFTEKTLIALFPTPVLRFFGSSLDKDDLRFSMGDVLYAAQYGTNIGINNYKLGSSVAHGIALMGVMSCLAIVPMFLILFVAMQSLTSTKNNIVIMSPVILMQLITLYYISAGDSYFMPLHFLLRTFPQNILIYFLAFHFARMIADLIIFIGNSGKVLASR